MFLTESSQIESTVRKGIQRRWGREGEGERDGIAKSDKGGEKGERPRMIAHNFVIFLSGTKKGEKHCWRCSKDAGIGGDFAA